MNRTLLLGLVLVACSPTDVPPADAAPRSIPDVEAPQWLLLADLDRVVSRYQAQLPRIAASMPSPSHSPKATRADGSWTTEDAAAPVAWTQGFFPGLLWQLHELDGDPSWRELADRWTLPLEVQKTNRQTHDLGFKLLTSFGPSFRLTGNAAHRDVLLTAAESLASRFDPALGIIVCCDWNTAWKRPLVVDTMVNLELLLWAAANGGPPEWREMAVRHGLTTLSAMVRPDGGTYHVVDYEPTTGAIRFRGTFQGHADESTWARGQAWAMYGFTELYRYTGDAQMLAAARKVSDFYLARVGTDFVPNWDFDSPIQKRDSSTAAAAASALIELARLTEDTRYRDAATRTLEVLRGPGYLSSGTATLEVLRHGVGHLPAGQEIDVGLIYGDYYFLESVRRMRATLTLHRGTLQGIP
jgi:unsaturated chondroitin disaccharide hydrolase